MNADTPTILAALDVAMKACERESANYAGPYRRDPLNGIKWNPRIVAAAEANAKPYDDAIEILRTLRSQIEKERPFLKVAPLPHWLP